MSDFQKGFDIFISAQAGYAGIVGTDYVSIVEKEIINLNDDINKFAGYKTDVSKLKGDIAEFWHADTHNIDAALKGKSVRAEIPRSNELGSVDIQLGGQNYSSKYDAIGVHSAKQQAKSIYERYREYLSQSKKTEDDISFAEYLSNNNYDSKNADKIKHNPLYAGQGRLIPKDQMEDAISFLKRKIAEEADKRPELVKKYQETLDLLTDKIQSNQGTSSIPLTKAEAENIARLAKEGKFTPEDMGISTEKLITADYIFEEALKAGVSAAIISAVLACAPEIYKLIDSLFRTGEIDKEQFKKIGWKAVSSSTENFIRGGISASLTIAIRSGKFGAALKGLDSSVISSTVVIAFNAVKNSYLVATHKMTRGEFADACVRDLFVTSVSIALGSATQALMPEIPVIGYLLGSFIGSVSASFVYDVGYKQVMSFCVDSGFTFFGLVEQDYELPQEIIEELGIETFTPETFEVETFEVETFTPEKFEVETFTPETLDITILRRGVIGVNKIGYV